MQFYFIEIRTLLSRKNHYLFNHTQGSFTSKILLLLYIWCKEEEEWERPRVERRIDIK